jgi:hypothetical protein
VCAAYGRPHAGTELRRRGGEESRRQCAISSDPSRLTYGRAILCDQALLCAESDAEAERLRRLLEATVRSAAQWHGWGAALNKRWIFQRMRWSAAARECERNREARREAQAGTELFAKAPPRCRLPRWPSGHAPCSARATFATAVGAEGAGGRAAAHTAACKGDTGRGDLSGPRLQIRRTIIRIRDTRRTGDGSTRDGARASFPAV